MSRWFSLGGHNLHDEDGDPAFYADAMLFTEAVEERVRDEAPQRYRVLPCPEQRDLIVCLDRDVFGPGYGDYEPAHGGTEEVTPHRGTWFVRTRLLRTDQPWVVFAEHRVNAAFEPFVRGEPELRQWLWRHHTAVTLTQVRRYLRRGLRVAGGGDCNTPHGTSAYRGVLEERGERLDRLAASTDVRRFTALGYGDSDHRRTRMEVRA